MSERIAALQEQAKQAYADSTTPQLKYGLTIRLNTKGLTLEDHEDPQSAQESDVEHENCEVMPLFESTHDDIEKHLYTAKPAEHTRFDDYNHAHAAHGLFIRVPEGKNATCTLTRRFSGQAHVEHILVVAHKNSTLTLTDQQSGDPYLRSATVEVIAHQNAHVQYSTVESLDETWDLTSYRAQAHKDARIDWFIASLGTGFQRATADTTLQGEGAQARSYGVFLGSSHEQFDLSATTFHKASHTSSDMHTKGVLDGKTKGVYRGTIDIDAQAFGCDGYQKEHTILLGEQAIADAIPNLEIRNNDVRCSHGATIGRVDDEQLFYLTSRGVDRTQAVKMLVKGFFEPLTAALDQPDLYDRILPLIEEKIR